MWKNVVTALVSTLVMLALGEVGLRIAGLFEPPPFPPEPRWPELYTSHPDYGYALFPSRTTTYGYPLNAPRRLTVTSNRDGFRSRRELDDPDEGPGGRTRVLVTGDSYVFGQGVEAEERFTNVLEDLRPELRVDNTGMTGWGVDMMLLALEATVERADPDVLIVTLYFDDFRRVRRRYSGVGFPIPRLVLEGDSLGVRPYPEPKPWERLRLYHGAYRALAGGYRPLARPSAAEWEINRRALDRMRRISASRNAEMMLVYLPAPIESPVNEIRWEWVRDYGERFGLATLDMSGRIYADSVRAFIPHNSHYTPHGHRLVAEAIAAHFGARAAPDADSAGRPR